MSATVNKSISGVQTRFNRRSQPPPLLDELPQIVTRNSTCKNPELEDMPSDVRKAIDPSKMWRSTRTDEDLITEDTLSIKEHGINAISCNGDAFFSEKDENDKVSDPASENGVVDTPDSVSTSTNMDIADEKAKGAKQLRSLVNRLAPSPGFVDKNSVPSDTQNRRRVRRLASLNAAAKVNVFFEPSSSLAGRSLTDIMQHSKKIHGTDNGEGGEQAADGKENNVSRPRGRPRSVSKIDNSYLKSPDMLFDARSSSVGFGELENCTSFASTSVLKRAQDESENDVQTKRTKVDENGCYATINANRRVFMGKEVIDVGLQVELPKLKVTTTSAPTRASQCKCRSTKVIDVPIQSYVSTYSNGTLVSIPITKTHRLTPQLPERPAPELAQGDLACRSKRIAGLNSRAMLNAILTEERTIPTVVNTARYRKTSTTQGKKSFYEHGLNNTVPSVLKIPKINFAATSTSNFSAFGRGKSFASHTAKGSAWQKSGLLSHDGPKRTNGWFFLDPAVVKPYYYNDCTATRKYYSGIKRNNEVIYARDSVLLKSGPRRKDLPFVARVSGFWEEIQGPNAGEMMMSVLWYYRPEQTEIGKQPDIHGENEILASRHKDDNSVACIVDKCYVLSYPEYCRYRAAVKRLHDSRGPSPNPVPPGAIQAKKTGDVAPLTADPKLVFFCRQIYDYRMGRVLKNPVMYNPSLW